MTAQWRVTRAIGCEDPCLENFSTDGGGIGRALEDATSTEALKMQGENGLAPVDWTVPQIQAPLEERSHLIVLHRMGGQGSLNFRSHRFAFDRIVGEEKQRGAGGKLEGCCVTSTRFEWHRVNQPSPGAVEDQCARSAACSP